MTTTNYEAEVAAATARLAAAQAEVDDLRAKLAAEHAAAHGAQQGVESTSRGTTAADGKAAAQRRFAVKADDATNTSHNSAAAGREAARARFGKRP